MVALQRFPVGSQNRPEMASGTNRICGRIAKSDNAWFVNYHSCMTPEEAKQIIVEGINYAAYRETDSSLHDSDKNRLFGSEHYNSGRHVVKPSPWSEGNFEEKMAMLLRWANTLNASVPNFAQAQALLEAADSVIGRVIRVIRLSKVHQGR